MLLELAREEYRIVQYHSRNGSPRDEAGTVGRGCACAAVPVGIVPADTVLVGIVPVGTAPAAGTPVTYYVKITIIEAEIRVK